MSGGKERRRASEAAEENAPVARRTWRCARPVAPAAEVWARTGVWDPRRGIVDKAYHFIDMKHQARGEGFIGSGKGNGMEGPVVGGKRAIIFLYTAAKADYVVMLAAAALRLRRKGAEHGIRAPPPSLAVTRAVAQAVTTGMSVTATSSVAPNLGKGIVASHGARSPTRRAP